MNRVITCLCHVCQWKDSEWRRAALMLLWACRAIMLWSNRGKLPGARASLRVWTDSQSEWTLTLSCYYHMCLCYTCCFVLALVSRGATSWAWIHHYCPLVAVSATAPPDNSSPLTTIIISWWPSKTIRYLERAFIVELSWHWVLAMFLFGALTSSGTIFSLLNYTIIATKREEHIYTWRTALYLWQSEMQILMASASVELLHLLIWFVNYPQI